MKQLRSLLTTDVTLYADSGGKKPAALQPVVGIDDVTALHASLAAMFAENMSRLLHHGYINGLPGYVTMERDDTLQTTALQIDAGKIVTIYITRNPDKLRHLDHGSIH